MEHTERLKQLLDRLRTQGRRLTPQRLAIVEAVLTCDGHPSVEDIHKRILQHYPTTSLATVYKTMHLLKEEGELLELEFGEKGNRYDGLRPAPHPHLICTRCGSIRDCDLEGLDELVARLAQGGGYTAQSHRFDIYGVCPACRGKG